MGGDDSWDETGEAEINRKNARNPQRETDFTYYSIINQGYFTKIGAMPPVEYIPRNSTEYIMQELCQVLFQGNCM
jgi:hypothetical protein